MAEVIRVHLDPCADIDAEFPLLVADAVRGVLVLAVSPRLCRAGPYHAMDFARGLCTWPAHARRSGGAVVNARVWAVMRCAQHCDSPSAGPANDPCVYFGVQDAARAQALLVRLRLVARELSGERVTEVLSWPGLLVFLCEMRQTLKHPAVGRAGVERVLAADRSQYISAALAQRRALWEKGATGRDCYMVCLFRAALSSLESS